MQRRTFIAAAAATAVSTSALPAFAAGGRPIRIVVPYAAGGAIDLSVRKMATALESDLGTIIIDNRPGGGGGIGMTAVVDDEQRVIGIFTDGDLRRAFERQIELLSLTVGDVMTARPRTIRPEKLAVEAVEMMEQFKINALPVTDVDGRLVGALNMHDLFRAKVI